MPAICWLGLGRMGLPMAAHLQSSGFTVRAYDPDPAARREARDAGIEPYDSPVEAASGVEVVFTMLPTYAHVARALTSENLLEVTAEGALVVDCSTTSGGDARQLSALVSGSGRRFVDAPVSGGTPGAQAGTLTFMVGGDERAVDRISPCLKAMGSRIFHVGDVGCGQNAKMVNNMMLAMNMASVCEAAALAGRLGLDHAVVHDIVTVSSGDSWVLREFYPVAGVVENSPANRDFAPGFTTELMRKDVGLALGAAADHSLDLTMTSQVALLLDRLTASGLGRHDFSALIRLVDQQLDGAADDVLL